MADYQRVSPFDCRMWHMHDRLGDEITNETCRDLIRSIEKHGQKHPVLARSLNGDHTHKFELIYGARRLFAARQLRTQLLIEVRDLDDRMAVIEMDVENRVRCDISAYERGMSYKRWLRTGLFESQAKLAEAVGVSRSQVSRLLRYAELPTVVVAAFGSPRDIREEWAVTLARCCTDPNHRKTALERARQLRACSKSYSPQQVFDRIVRRVHLRSMPESTRDEVVRGTDGRPLFKVRYRAATVHLVIPRSKLTSDALDKLKASTKAELDAGDGMRAALHAHSECDRSVCGGLADTRPAGKPRFEESSSRGGSTWSAPPNVDCAAHVPGNRLRSGSVESNGRRAKRK